MQRRIHLLEALDGLFVVRLGRLELTHAVQAEADIVHKGAARARVGARLGFLRHGERVREQVQRLLPVLRVALLARLLEQLRLERRELAHGDVGANLRVVLLHAVADLGRHPLHANLLVPLLRRGGVHDVTEPTKSEVKAFRVNDFTFLRTNIYGRTSYKCHAA